MKKFMRIALVFALAGATLVGCTKDYSGDISDLNKKVSEQSAAVTALQNAVSNAQTAADAAAATANTALSTAKAAATADELNAVKAELAKAATADALTAVDAKYAAYIPAIEAAAKAADLEEFKALVTEEIAKLATKEEVAAFKAAYDEMVAALKAADTENAGKIAELKAACETKFAALDAADKENADAIVALQGALAAAIEEGKAADKKNADAIVALEAALAKAIANTDVSIEDIKAALATKADKTEFDAAVERILALETNYIALEARVLALEAVDEDLKVLIAKNAEGIEANAKDIAALQELVEALTAQIEGTFSVTALRSTAQYVLAKWKPSTKPTESGYFAKVAEVFPELKEIKVGTEIEIFDKLNFIVNPSSVALDDTYTFSLVNTDGRDSGVELGNPALGYVETKAGSNVWNVEVQGPAFDADGKAESAKYLSLVVENADGYAVQTTFDYGVDYTDCRKENNDFEVDGSEDAEFSFNGKPYDVWKNDLFTVSSNNVPLYENYFVIKVNDPADAEEFGITISGSKITFESAPIGGRVIGFTMYAVGVNGRAATAEATLNLKGAIAPNAELAAKEITLAKEKNYVKYDVADFGFSALEWRTVYESLAENEQDGVTLFKPESVKEEFASYDVIFFNKNGEKFNAAPDVKDYATVAAFGFELTPSAFIPETYPVRITDGSVFCGVGELTVVNPDVEKIGAIKILDSICDEDGVLLAVGNSDGGYITYDFSKALIADDDVVGDKLTFKYNDLDFDEDAYEEDLVSNYNWITDKNLVIPINGAPDDHGDKYNYVNNTVRNIAATFYFFGNNDDETGNKGEFDFQVKVISPVYSEGAKTITMASEAEATIYFTPTAGADEKVKPTSIRVDQLIKSGKYVAGQHATQTYAPVATWRFDGTPAKDAVKKPWYDFENRVGVGSFIEVEAVIIPDDIQTEIFNQVAEAIETPAENDSRWSKTDGGDYPGYNVTRDETLTVSINTTVLPAFTGSNGKTYYNVTVTGLKVEFSRHLTSVYTYPQWRWQYGTPSKKVNKATANVTCDGTKWLVDGDGKFVTIDTKGVNVNVLLGFGFASTEIKNFLENTESFNLTDQMCQHAWEIWAIDHNNWGAVVPEGAKANPQGAAFDAIKAYFAEDKEFTPADPGNPHYAKVGAANEIASVYMIFDNADKAMKFVKLNPTTTPLTDNGYDVLYGNDEESSVDPTIYLSADWAYASEHMAELVGNQAKVTGFFVITDKWGMTMKAPFAIVVKINPDDKQ